jgi:hypothetical protein
MIGRSHLTALLAALGLGRAEQAGYATGGVVKPLEPGKSTLLRPGEILVPMRPAWKALPGNRIELGATGFAIEAHWDDPAGNVYRIINPEGVLVAWGGPMMLQGLKGMAEQLAKDREEFVAQPQDWRQ